MKTTQTWEIGNAEILLTKISAGSIDLVVTDPPYKISQNYGNGVDADNLMGVAGILRTFPEISRVLKDGRFFFCFYDNRILPFCLKQLKELIWYTEKPFTFIVDGEMLIDG